MSTTCTTLRSSFIQLAANAVNCPFRDRCRAECSSMTKHPPQPGFLGRRYAGLVVIGANPGVRYTDDPNDRDYTGAIDRLAETGSAEDFEALHDITSNYMLSWPNNLANRRNRELLDYDIESIAYLNIAKCRTVVAASDVAKTVGLASAQRCFETHLRDQLDLLNPQRIVFHWIPIESRLREFGYAPGQGTLHAAFSGQRNLRLAQRLSTIRPLFDGLS